MDFTYDKAVLFFKRQVPTIMLIWVLSLILSYPDRNIVQITIGIIFAQFWSYFTHRLGHEMPTEGILGMLNTHWNFHHQKSKLLPRWFELSIEAYTDMGLNMSLLYIQMFSGIMFVPLSLLIFNALIYTSTHIVNYSNFGSSIHKKHHLNHKTNFGPDTWDHLFSSSEDGEIEDMTLICINAVAAFCIVYTMKKWIGWID